MIWLELSFSQLFRLVSFNLDFYLQKLCFFPSSPISFSCPISSPSQICSFFPRTLLPYYFRAPSPIAIWPICLFAPLPPSPIASFPYWFLPPLLSSPIAFLPPCLLPPFPLPLLPSCPIASFPQFIPPIALSPNCLVVLLFLLQRKLSAGPWRIRQILLSYFQAELDRAVTRLKVEKAELESELREEQGKCEIILSDLRQSNEVCLSFYVMQLCNRKLAIHHFQYPFHKEWWTNWV